MLSSMFLRMAYTGSEWVLWVLAILSFVSVAFIVDRAIYFARHAVDLDELLPQLRQMLKEGNIRGAYNLVQGSPTIECAVVAEGLKALHRGPQACSEAMLSAKAHERGPVEARLAALATIGSNAPFIGLLGTVLGIIKAARDLSDSSGAGAGAVMSGVFEALVATAVGLFVAIPAIVAYNIFQKKVRGTMGQVETLAHLVLANLKPDQAPAQQPAPAPTQAPAQPPQQQAYQQTPQQGGRPIPVSSTLG